MQNTNDLKLMQRSHQLKCWPGPFEAVLSGDKTFEYRKDDRGFEVGDIICLREWDPSRFSETNNEELSYTGRVIIADITYIAHGGRFNIPSGCCVMSIKKTSSCRISESNNKSILDNPSEPKLGDTRIKTGFLFFPKLIKNEWRWLKKAKWKEKYIKFWTTDMAGPSWETEDWHSFEWIDN